MCNVFHREKAVGNIEGQNFFPHKPLRMWGMFCDLFFIIINKAPLSLEEFRGQRSQELNVGSKCQVLSNTYTTSVPSEIFHSRREEDLG